MKAIPVKHCPSVALLPLPSAEVKSYDSKQLKLGTLIYFRFTAVPQATEYVVVSDKAIRRSDGRYEIVVLGPGGYAIGMDPKDFVVSKTEWWNWYQKRYGSQKGNIDG